MGGCFSSKAVEAAAPKAPPVDAPKEKPKPMVFALMRNGHEVIRGSQRDLCAAVKEGDLELATDVWNKLTKWSKLHMRMEEGAPDCKSIGMFALLDREFDGASSNAHLHDQHVTLEEKEKALDQAFQSQDMEAIKKTFVVFDEANLDHLKKEEGIMMPLVSKMAQTGHNLKEYMQTEILPLVSNDPDFEFWVRYANDVLERHAEGMPRVRVFDHALWAVATPEQWAVWDKWIQETLSEEKYKEVQDAILA